MAGTFSGSKGIAEMEAPVRMPQGEDLGSMEGLVLRLASDGRAYSFYLRTGPPYFLFCRWKNGQKMRTATALDGACLEHWKFGKQ